jgi:hypothetical protein
MSTSSPRTGCSSMPLGATPVWPWGLSKKPTPLNVARLLNLCRLCASAHRNLADSGGLERRCTVSR